MSEYIQARTPDLILLGELLNRAKGPNRTMAQFAEDCGIGASTLSRILNGKIAKALPERMLQSILAHSDDPQITQEALYSANGMIARDQYEYMRYRNEMAHGLRPRERTEQVEHMLINELLNRGYAVRRIDRFRRKDWKTARAGHIEFGLWDESFDMEWGIYICHYEDYPEVVNRPSRLAVRRFMDMVNGVFLEDAWYPHKFANRITTFMFFSYEAFEEFVSKLEDAPINSCMTAVLMNPSTLEVEKEYALSPMGVKSPLSAEVCIKSYDDSGEEDDNDSEEDSEW